MNKKGFLLGEENTKLLIGVGCIILILIVAGFIYYGFISGGQEIEQAKATAKLLNNRMEDVQGSEQFLVESPEDWVIVAWPNSVLFKKPNVCKSGYDESCICVCEGSMIWAEIFSNCNKEGLCQDIDKRVEVKDTLIKIEGTIGLNLTLEGSSLKLEKMA